MPVLRLLKREKVDCNQDAPVTHVAAQVMTNCILAFVGRLLVVRQIACPWMLVSSARVRTKFAVSESANVGATFGRPQICADNDSAGENSLTLRLATTWRTKRRSYAATCVWLRSNRANFFCLKSNMLTHASHLALWPTCCQVI